MHLPPLVGYPPRRGVAMGPWTARFLSATRRPSASWPRLGVLFLDVSASACTFRSTTLWDVRKIAIPWRYHPDHHRRRPRLPAHTELGDGRRAPGLNPGPVAISVASTVGPTAGALMDHAPARLHPWPRRRRLVGLRGFWRPVGHPGPAATRGEHPPRRGSRALIAVIAIGKAVAVCRPDDGRRQAAFIPLLLNRIVRPRNRRELFIVVSLTIAIGTALAVGGPGSGLSLAPRRIHRRRHRRRIAVQPSGRRRTCSPSRESFQVLFFVSVGMLVNPVYLTRALAGGPGALGASSSSARPRSRRCAGFRLSLSCAARRSWVACRSESGRRIFVHRRPERASRWVCSSKSQ